MGEVGRLVQRRREEVQAERPGDLEHSADGVLVGVYVVVGHPDVVVVAPALPLVQQLTQPGPLRASNDLADDTVTLLLRRECFIGHQAEVPVSGPARLGPTRVQGVLADTRQDEVLLHRSPTRSACTSDQESTTAAAPAASKSAARASRSSGGTNRRFP